jgi:2,4-dienoyl-CoA reductase-like NADH-dependent reductase (Old Yellow Enzyme family)
MSHPFSKTFSAFSLAGQTIKNRIVMAPLTRQVAEDDGTPTAEMAAYYARRARGGLGMIISEGTFFNDELGCAAYLSQPGIANTKHIEGWQKTTSAVHACGVPILCQLMHGGRVSDPRCLHESEQPVSASDGQSPGAVLYTDNDSEKNDRLIEGDWPKVTFPPCRALSVAEIERIADGFAEGAVRAIEAGFDGVEIHAANGYLLYQFLHPSVNKRDDTFGGSPERNIAFAKLVCQRTRAAIGPDKIITLRLSQDGVDDFTGAWEGGVEYARAVGEALQDVDADALHWSSFDWRDNRDPQSDVPMPKVLAEASGKPLIVNGGIVDGSASEAALNEGGGEFCAVGRPLFAHPDWPHIIRSGEKYDWIEFDRKHVIRPSYDYTFGYPANLASFNWNPDLSLRRKPGWMD